MALEKIESQKSPNISDFTNEIQLDLEQAKKTLKDLSLILEQSQSELGKLVQRNSAITGQLNQQINQVSEVIPSDLRMAYTNAMEAQQRMIVMRGQLEKLQSEQTSLKKYVDLIERIQAFLSKESQAGTSQGESKQTASLEMLINAQETERQRLSRQMHDGPAQAMSNFIVQADIVSRLLEIDPAKAKDEITNLKTAAMSTFQKVRAFITELRPMMLDDLGLIPTVKRYGESFKEQNSVEVTLSVTGGDKRLQPYLEVMVFRAVQELMDNAVQHNLENPGKLQITVQMVIDVDLVKVSVGDNGVGFDPDSIGKSNGLGLKLIKERVEMLGGKMQIDSFPGKGSTIFFQIPFVEIKPESKE
jgi:two-component system sensor histidine kinase DegS